MADRVGTLADVLGQAVSGKSSSSGSARLVYNGACHGCNQVELWDMPSPYCRNCVAEGKDVQALQTGALTAESIRASAAASAEVVHVSVDGADDPEMVRRAVVAATLARTVPGAEPVHAGDGGTDDCMCDCGPCGGDDCDNCACAACECEGCDCASAMAKLKAKTDAKAEQELAQVRARNFDRMRHEMSQAAAR